MSTRIPRIATEIHPFSLALPFYVAILIFSSGDALAAPPSVCKLTTAAPIGVVNSETIERTVFSRSVCPLDLLLTCTGGDPQPVGTPLPTGEFHLFLNTNITNPAMSDGLTNSVLLIDDFVNIDSSKWVVGKHQTWNPTLTELILGSANGSTTYTQPGAPNFFLGTQRGVNQLSWTVPIDWAGAGKDRTFRFTNILADASSIHDPNPKLQATLTFSLTGGVAPTISPSTVDAGKINTDGYYFGISKTLSFFDGTSQNLSLYNKPAALPTNPVSSWAMFSDNGVPGLFVPKGDLTAATPTYGIGTRYDFKIGASYSFFKENYSGSKFYGKFEGLPPLSSNYKFDLAVPNKFVSGGIELSLVSPATDLGNGLSFLPQTANSASAVWELLKKVPTGITSFDIPIYPVTQAGGFQFNSPPSGTNITMRAGFAPQSMTGDPTDFVTGFHQPFISSTIISASGLPNSVFAKPLGPDCLLSANPRYLSLGIPYSGNGCAYGAGRRFQIYSSTAPITSGTADVNGAWVSSVGSLGGGTYGAQFAGVPGRSILSIARETAPAVPQGTTSQAYSSALPLNIEVRFSPDATAPGTSTGSLTFKATNGPSVSTTFPITVIDKNAPVILPENFKDVADYRNGSVAAGQIFSLFPDFYPQTQFVQGTVTNGKLGTSIANTQLFFDDVPAPLLFVANGQVTGVVPFGVAGKASTKVKLVYNGLASPVIDLPVQAASISIVSADGTGGGPCSCLNPNASVNTRSNPAKAGDTVTMIVAYAGPMDIAGTDGRTTISAPYNKPKGTVSVSIGGVTVTGQATDFPYVGNLPGFLESAQQWNVRIPAGLTPGENSIQISAGGATSTPWATIWIGQ
jgi:uncharacterized protein (TIGR03437 family)